MWRISLLIILNLFLQIGNTFSQKTNPPGTTLLRDNLYIDLAPMANIHYREYEYFMSNFINYNLDSFQKLVASLPMSGVAFKEFLTQLRFEPNRDSATLKINRDATFSWSKPENFEIYLSHPAYNFYPVVNITYEMAKGFCEWRTAAVQLNYASATSEKEREKHFRKIKYRLLTREEWEFAKQKFTQTKRLYQSQQPSPPFKKRFTITNLAELVNSDGMLVNSVSEVRPNIDMITFRCICEVED